MAQDIDDTLAKELMAKYGGTEVALLKLDDEEIAELERLEYEVVGEYDDEY